MRWNLHNHSTSWSWLGNTADWEVPVILTQKVVLGEFIDSSDFENSSVGNKWLFTFNLITCQISVSNELLTRLVDIEGLRQSLPSQVDRERITSIIREVNLSDLNCIVSQEIMPLELKVCTLCVESENFPIIIKELFLRWYAATTEFFLQEFQEFWVFLWWNWLLRDNEFVIRARLGSCL